MADATQPADDQGEESPQQRLDRNTIELLNELRVAVTGIQVLFGFLLIVPFNTGFRRVDSFDRGVYFTTLICIAISAILLLAPAIHHRILFRHHQRPYLVRSANRIVILAMMFLAAGLTGILLLISDVVLGGPWGVVVGALTAVTLAGVWFGIPMSRRERS
jgi:Family of unknown function (DUF6328)